MADCSRLCSPRTRLLTLSALVVLAALVRLVHLWDIPSPTDELLSVAKALGIARGAMLPLTDDEPYIGAFWNYLVAGFYLLFGADQRISRLVALGAGSLTVIAAYLLGREIRSVAVGYIAAVLLATSSAHVLATSHPAWSHCLVPLFGTLGYWQLLRALRMSSGRQIVLCGVWFGLALQVHLTSLALLPGAMLLVLLRGRRWIASPYPYLAAAVAGLLIVNLIAHNVSTGLGSMRRADEAREAYAAGKGSGLTLYAGSAQRLGIGLVRTVSGSIDIRSAPIDYLLDPLTIAAVGLSIVGLVVLARRRQWTPVFAIGPYLALLLLFNGKYEAIPNSRFLTPILPFLFAGSAAAIWSVASRTPSQNGRAVLAVVMTAGLATLSLAGLDRRLTQMESSAATTAGLYAAVELVESQRRPDEAVMLDRNLDKLWLDGGGDVWMALSFEFDRRGAPLGDLPGRVAPRTGDISPCDRQTLLAVRVDRSIETPQWLTSAVAADPAVVPKKFWTFRVVPRSTTTERLTPGEQVAFQYIPPINGSARAVDRCVPGRQI